MALDIDKALKELKQTSLADIQKATAYTWASRACAAFQYAMETKDNAEHIKWLSDYGEYKHEAIEHAALQEQGSGLLTEILKLMDDFEQKILKS